MRYLAIVLLAFVAAGCEPMEDPHQLYQRVTVVPAPELSVHIGNIDQGEIGGTSFEFTVCLKNNEDKELAVEVITDFTTDRRETQQRTLSFNVPPNAVRKVDGCRVTMTKEFTSVSANCRLTKKTYVT